MFVEEAEAETENMIIGVCLYIYKEVCLSSFITIYSAPAYVFPHYNMAETEYTETTKKIHVPISALVSSSSKNKSRPKTEPTTPAPTAPKKRVITTTKQWNFQTDELTPEYQLFLLSQLNQNERITDIPDEILRKRLLLLKQHIHLKWYGYRAQDMEKHLFRPELLISEKDIVELLLDSRLLCFYCRNPIQLLYENVRESSQWSIERIDNQYGHNRENVVVACLGCNLRRKTMYYERFRMTKQLSISKKM